MLFGLLICVCVWGGVMEFFSKAEKSVNIQMNPMASVLHQGVLMQRKGRSQNQSLENQTQGWSSNRNVLMFFSPSIPCFLHQGFFFF